MRPSENASSHISKHMKPKILYNGARPLIVLADEGESSDLEKELAAFRNDRQTVRKAAALEIIMERFAAGEKLPSAMFHEAGEADGLKVMEFIKQPIRIYAVPIPGTKGMLLLTHSVWKKWQKTKAADLKKAANAFNKLQISGAIKCLITD